MQSYHAVKTWWPTTETHTLSCTTMVAWTAFVSILMKTACPIFLSLLFFGAVAAAQSPDVGTIAKTLRVKSRALNSKYLVYSPDTKAGTRAPLVIYLHGGGGVGDDIRKISGQVTLVWKAMRDFVEEPCYLAAPQCVSKVKEGGGWLADDLNIFLAHLKATYHIDETRIYLTGNSMGGYGSWMWGGHNPEHFAAIAPVSGGIGPGGPLDVTENLYAWAVNLAKVPVYAFAGAKDEVVPSERSERIVAAIRKAGGKEAKLTIYPDRAHDARLSAYGSAEFYDWMFSKKRE